MQITVYGQPGRYKIIAYYTGNGETIRQYPLDKLTHVIFSFLKLQNDTLCFHNDQQRESLRQIVALKKDHPHLKVMVSIGGWSGCAPCSELFASAEHRQTFARTAVSLFRANGIDGLDLDWEYPAIEGYPGHKFDSSDRDHFTELIRDLRREMGTDFLLSFAAGGFIRYLEHSVNWPAVLPLVDFVNLMTYDLVGGYATVTGHHTPPRSGGPGEESAEKCVRWLLEHGAPAAKLVTGAAFYARVWENVPDTRRGLYQPGRFKQGVAYRNFRLYFTDSMGYRYYRDRKTRAPYRYSRSLHLFATFDDRWSLRHKTRFIRRHGLGGIMFWELSQDLPRAGLVEAISRGLRRGGDREYMKYIK